MKIPRVWNLWGASLYVFNMFFCALSFPQKVVPCRVLVGFRLGFWQGRFVGGSVFIHQVAPTVLAPSLLPLGRDLPHSFGGGS